MALVIKDYSTHAVPANLVLVYSENGAYKSKMSDGTYGVVSADDLFRLDIEAIDLPRYVFVEDYNAVKAMAARVNPDMNSAFETTAAAKAITAVDLKKVSKADFATEQQLNAEKHAALDKAIVDEASAREAAIAALDGSINFGKLIDRIWIYPDGVVDLSLMVKPGMYFCTTNAATVGTPHVGMPEGAVEGCVIVLENGQIFVEGLTGRSYYRHQDDASNVVTQYTQDWIAGALLSDVQKHVADVSEKFLSYTTDYTAVEVLATDAVIAAGTVDDVTGFTYKSDVAADMEATFKLRTNCPTVESDVIVDWGDGARSYIKDADQADVTLDGNEVNVMVRHTYETPGRYIVKFFGNKYFGFGSGRKSIVSRAFASDLPLAQHVNATGNIAWGSDRLLKVDIPTYMLSEGLWNLNAMFSNNPNLVEITGARYIQGDVRNCSWMFSGDTALVNTDFIFPAYIRDGALSYAFTNNKSLAVDIAKLFPAQGFIGAGKYDVKQMFMNCAALTGTVPAAKLWENTNITWVNTSEAFIGCSDAIRAQVPVSWGGTNEDIEAKLQAGYFDKVIKNDLDVLEANAAATTGSQAIVVDGDGATKTVSLKLDGKTLAQSDAGLKSVVKVVKQESADEGYAATYFLADSDGVALADSAKINVVKDQFLKGTELVTGTGEEVNGFVLADGEKYIHFIFELTKGNDDTADDTDSHIYLDVNDLFDSYTSGNAAIAIDQTANTVSLVIDNSDTVVIGEGQTTAILSIGSEGVKVNGIQAAIDYAKGVEQARAEAAEKGLSDRLDVIEGEGEGSIAKAAADVTAAAAQDATNKANAAQATAISTAAADATAKSNAAQAAAIETASADATAKANAAEAAAKAKASEDLTAHADTNTLHLAEVLFVRQAETVAAMDYKRYICKAALAGTLPAAPAEGTKRVVSVLAGGEGTIIHPADGDKINGAAAGLAINIANETVELFYDAEDKNWVVL